jgi:hypothetical protein
LPFAFDFAANRLPPPWGRTYPIGLDLEVCSFARLELAWEEAALPHQREHVMPFFYEQPDRFRILLLNHPVDYGSLRWTVDTADDLELLRQSLPTLIATTSPGWKFWTCSSASEISVILGTSQRLPRYHRHGAGKLAGKYHNVLRQPEKPQNNLLLRIGAGCMAAVTVLFAVATPNHPMKATRTQFLHGRQWRVRAT